MPKKFTRPALTGPTITLPYVRLSSAEQHDKGLSILTQKAEQGTYINDRLRPCVVRDTYQDLLSGQRDDRPGYQTLLAEARRLVAEGYRVIIVVVNLDRFGRSVGERVRAWNELKALGVELHATRLGGPVPEFVYNVLAAMAQEEVRLNSERVKAENVFVRDAGWYPQGRAPLGYRWRPATPAERAAHSRKSVIEPDPDTKETILVIYQRLAAGESLRAVARWVASLPAALRGDRAMFFNGVRQLVQSPTYCARPRHCTPRDIADAPPQQWEPLVTVELWLAANRHIAGHQRLPHQAGGGRLLTGFLHCPRCGGRCAAGQRRNRAQETVELYQCLRKGNLTPAGPCHWTGLAATYDAPVRAALARVLALIAQGPGRHELERAWAERNQPRPGTATAKLLARLEAEVERADRTIAAGYQRLVLLQGTPEAVAEEARYHITMRVVEADKAAALAEIERRRDAAPATVPVDDVVGLWTLADRLAPLVEALPVAKLRVALADWVEQVTAERQAFGRYAVRLVWTTAARELIALAGPAVEAAAAAQYEVGRWSGEGLRSRPMSRLTNAAPCIGQPHDLVKGMDL